MRKKLETALRREGVVKVKGHKTTKGFCLCPNGHRVKAVLLAKGLERDRWAMVCPECHSTWIGWNR